MKKLKQFRSSARPRLAGLLFLVISSSLVALAPAQGEFLSQMLTDAIYKGDGVIDLLKDVSGTQLEGFIDESSGKLLLGVDVNENNSGNENSDSLGAAISQVQLFISTTDGDFTFADFLTGTTAVLREAGSETPEEYYTLFGTGGSSQITGAGGVNLSGFDDVLWLENIAFTGSITSAQLQVTFLDTPTSGATEAESFFDFSGGFEDFALLSTADAILLDSADLGVAAAPSGIEYQETTTVTSVLQAPGAPLPPGLAVAVLGVLFLLRTSRYKAE